MAEKNKNKASGIAKVFDYIWYIIASILVYLWPGVIVAGGIIWDLPWLWLTGAIVGGIWIIVLIVGFVLRNKKRAKK